MNRRSTISEKVKSLEHEQREKVSEINKEYEKKRLNLTKDHIFCEGDDLGWDEHFDFKKNRVIYERNKITVCNDWVHKKYFAYVDIECFDNIQVSQDCGYGECDEFAIARVIKHYRVCRKCGKAVLLDTEFVLDRYGNQDRSRTWCRMDSNSDIGDILKEYKKRMNEKFEKQLGRKLFNENDENSCEFSYAIIRTTMRNKPYVPKELQ